MTGLPRDTSFQEGLEALEATLAGGARRQIVGEVSKARSFDRAMRRLRDQMRAHRFAAGEFSAFAEHKWVKRADNLARQDGFHILHDWDGKADRFNDDMIPVEVANFAERMIRPPTIPGGRVALAVVLDYYFLHLVALLALRAWDEGDPNAHLDEIARLLDHLQGPEGSGQKFARHPTTAILIATSHFEPDHSAYERLLARMRSLNWRHRLNLALTHAAILGCHLTFGLEVTCGGKLGALRDDNVPDYPWLCEALATLMEAYAGREVAGEEDDGRHRIVEALLLGFMADPLAFLGPDPPASLAGCQAQRATLSNLFAAHRKTLLRDFETHHPGRHAYSPLAFTFNFPHNLVKGAVVDASFRGLAWPLTLDDLVTALPRLPDLDGSRRALAETLMGYALASPDTIRGRPRPAIVYDPTAGLRRFERTLAQLQSILVGSGS